jgi:hypothetical protein
MTNLHKYCCCDDILVEREHIFLIKNPRTRLPIRYTTFHCYLCDEELKDIKINHNEFESIEATQP